MENVEVHFHSGSMASVKDLTSDINLADKKWDLLIDFIIGKTKCVFFEGNRANDFDGLLKACLSENTKDIIAEDLAYFSVTMEVYQNRLLWGKASVNKLWLYYEYPAFIFAKESITTKEIEKAIQQYQTYSNLARSLSGVYVLHRGFEQNVLWINKSSDMAFPELNEQVRKQ